MRGKKVEKKCQRCKQPMLVREADVKRGWGKFCSKSCKAVTQERRTGQNAAHLRRQDRTDRDIHEDGIHPFSSEAFGN